MRSILGDVDFQYRELALFSPELMKAHVRNAELYHQRSTSTGAWGSVLTVADDAVPIASAIGFVKACVDIVELEESLLLASKAILAGRLALNTLPKVRLLIPTCPNQQNSSAYYQSLRDRFAASRAHVLKRIDQMLLHAHPLEALQAYAFVTGASPQQVLQHFLTVRLDSTQSALKIQSPDSLTIMHIIRSIKTTVSDINTLFPFTVQRCLNDLKSTSLLSHQDLQINLQRRRANIDLWMNQGLKRFMIWTKSDVLDGIKVDEMLETWKSEIEALLQDKVVGLFVEVQELDMLCSLRGEIISLLVETDEDVGPFEERICAIMADEIARQMTRLMTDRVKKLHDLEPLATELIANFKGLPLADFSDCSGRCIDLAMGATIFETTQTGADIILENGSGTTAPQRLCNSLLADRDQRPRQ
jgi:hypothetical protein